MTEKDVKIYICDFCGRMSEDKEFLKLHEECCPKNPKKKDRSEEEDKTSEETTRG